MQVRMQTSSRLEASTPRERGEDIRLVRRDLQAYFLCDGRDNRRAIGIITIIIITIRPWKDKWALVIEISGNVHDQSRLTYTARIAVYGKPISAVSNYQTLTQRAKLYVICRNFGSEFPQT